MSTVSQTNWRRFWDDKAMSREDFAATGRGSMDVVGFLHTVGEAARILKLGPADRLLDIGCGTGIMALALAPTVDRVHGIDLSPAMVARAERNSEGRHALSFTVGTVTDPGMESGACNKVLAYSVLQYLPDEASVAKAFAALAQLLPPDGLALYAANPDVGRKQDYVDRVNNSDGNDESRKRALALIDETLWFQPERLVELARAQGLAAEARPISARIWQHFYMFDLVARKTQ